MKKVMALVLAALMALSLCGCGESATSILKKEIVGTWVQDSPYTVDEAKDLLESYSFYEEEMAYTDLTHMKWVHTATFTADGKYSFSYDYDMTEQAYREFFDELIEGIYENLEQPDLYDVYGLTKADFAGLDDFREFYATQVFSFDSYAAYIDAMVEHIMTEAYDFAAKTDYDHGTYTVTSKGLEVKEAGDTTSYLMPAKIDGNTLTLTFEEGNEIFTRMN